MIGVMRLYWTFPQESILHKLKNSTKKMTNHKSVSFTCMRLFAVDRHLSLLLTPEQDLPLQNFLSKEQHVELVSALGCNLSNLGFPLATKVCRHEKIIKNSKNTLTESHAKQFQGTSKLFLYTQLMEKYFSSCKLWCTSQLVRFQSCPYLKKVLK